MNHCDSPSCALWNVLMLSAATPQMLNEIGGNCIQGGLYCVIIYFDLINVNTIELSGVLAECGIALFLHIPEDAGYGVGDILYPASPVKQAL